MLNMFSNVSAGDKAPEQINVIVEIPKGSRNKYELDEQKGVICLDRTLYGPQVFPFEYGFVPGTRSEDGDMLDVVLLATSATFPGCLVKAKPIGLIYMEDEAGVDNKIIAAPVEKIDPRFAGIDEVESLPEHQKKEIKEFFETYKRLEPNKWVKITGWDNAAKAKEIIVQAIQRYQSED